MITENPLEQFGTHSWYDWKWQQQNILRKAIDIPTFFPNLPLDEVIAISKYELRYRWGVTPYTLSLMKKDEDGNPSHDDPLVKQFIPVRGFRLDSSTDSYQGEERNWELPNDLVTPILQHKYRNKVLFRFPDSCLGYCGFCFEVGRTEDKDRRREYERDVWKKSLDYIKGHPEILEVVLSGGDPLLMDNDNLNRRLSDIYYSGASILGTPRGIRIHTRALSFNPYRFDEELVNIFSHPLANIHGLGIHITHPNEITDDFLNSTSDLRNGGWKGLILAQIPLLKGINDDKDTLEELFMSLYEEGIKPYYLLHSMPWSPAASQFRTSVKKGVQLINSLKRHIPNPAIPEYVIVHHHGKHTVPLEENGTPEFQYTTNSSGNPVIRFKNYLGNWEEYLDGGEE